MFKNLRDIYTADCEVIQFSDDQFYYPIFKNGRSSLRTYAKTNNLAVLINKQISSCEKITVFLRSPIERFVSGVHTFFYLQNKKILNSKNILKKIENFEIVNRHFIPQYLWLVHLHKFFDGYVEIQPVSVLHNILPNKDGPWTNNPLPWTPMTDEEKDIILSINNKYYTEVDQKLIKKYMNRLVRLRDIISDFKI